MLATAVDSKANLLARLETLRARLAALGVRSLGLFGSFARDEQTAESDVDFLIEFQTEQRNFDNVMDVAFLLEDTLGRKVEVVTAEALSPHIGPRIRNEVEIVLVIDRVSAPHSELQKKRHVDLFQLAGLTRSSAMGTLVTFAF